MDPMDKARYVEYLAEQQERIARASDEELGYLVLPSTYARNRLEADHFIDLLRDVPEVPSIPITRDGYCGCEDCRRMGSRYHPTDGRN